jgi:hypothetical protein
MHLRGLLTTKVIDLPKWKTLIPHENSRLLCKRIETCIIIVRWHLLLHVLLLSLLSLPLSHISLRLLADSATRLAPRVAGLAFCCRWKHQVLFVFLFSIVRSPSLGLFI